MRKLCALLFLWPSLAFAGNPGVVTQGTVTTNDVPYYQNAWTIKDSGIPYTSILTSVPPASTITLGTSTSATNPQRTSEAGTGFYSDTDATVKVAISGSNVTTVNATGFGIGAAPGFEFQAGPATTTGTVVINPNAVQAFSTGFMGIYLSNGAASAYYGICPTIPSSNSLYICLGGYFNGMGISGNSHSTNTAIFGVLNNNESGTGGSLIVYDNDKVMTHNNTLDDGTGNFSAAGNVNIATGKTYQINNTQIAASNLSNGTTGSGAVVLATSPALVTPALGTPASGVATNLTGTASGLTAGTVTTNANLTGPITSSGNATSIAAQTGTGSTFAMQAGPSFTGIVNTTGSYKISSVFGLSQDTTNNNQIVGDTTLASVSQVGGGFNGQSNIYIGQIGAAALTTGYANTCVGMLNTSNSIGAPCAAITTAHDITAIGFGALASDTTGIENTAVGTGTGATNTTGSSNALFGSDIESLTGATGYSFVTAVGRGALGVSSGSNNTAIGYEALNINTSGASMVAVGYQALGSLAGSTNYNVAIGYQAGFNFNDTTGTTTNSNTLVGAFAGFGTASSTSGLGNSCLGIACLFSNTTGADNSILGAGGGELITTGSNNTVLGYTVASSVLTTGSNNILVGTSSATTTPASGSNNEINIGGLLFWNTVSLAAPAVTSCGTSPSIDGNANNRSGTVTVGTVAAATCTVTFAGGGYTTWVHCRISSQSTIASFAYSYTKTVITVTGTSLVADKFDYDCDGY